MALLTVANDRGAGGDDGDEVAEATRPLHPTVCLVVIEYNTGKTTGVTPGPSPLHEARGRLGEPVQGVTIDVA